MTHVLNILRHEGGNQDAIGSDKSNCVFAASKALCASILMLLKSQFLMSLTIAEKNESIDEAAKGKCRTKERNCKTTS